MTEPPNPFSREGAAGAATPAAERADGRSRSRPVPIRGLAELPRRPELVRLRRTRHSDVRPRPGQPDRPTDTYGVGPYPLPDPNRPADPGQYPTSYPGPNPFLPTPYRPAAQIPTQSSTSPYGPLDLRSEPVRRRPLWIHPQHPSAGGARAGAGRRRAGRSVHGSGSPPSSSAVARGRRSSLTPSATRAWDRDGWAGSWASSGSSGRAHHPVLRHRIGRCLGPLSRESADSPGPARDRRRPGPGTS